MATPITPLKLEIGDIVKGRFVVKKKIGEGACGSVFLVQSTKDSKFRAAMKVEPFMKSKDDEILKMEVHVLKQLQKSKHACRLIMAAKTDTYSFIVMTLLGKELSELRRRMPDRKLSPATGIKVGIQALQALSEMHTVGFVHRDIKPDNFAISHAQKNLIMLFDFGLARQILVKDVNGKMVLREPRNKVAFRGTVRYCSVNVHHNKEQGRHDDLWSMLYMLIELITAKLPWKGMSRRDSGLKKDKVTDKELLEGCPQAFSELNIALKKLNYYDTPRYKKYRDLFKNELPRIKGKLEEPFEWEKEKEKDKKDKPLDCEPTQKVYSKELDERAEKDQTEDTDTGRDAEESAGSAPSDGNDMDNGGFCAENTLDDVPK